MMTKTIKFFLFGLLVYSLVIAQTIDLKFSHEFHVKQVEAPCLACHEAAGESSKPTDNLLPDMESCYGCHDPEGECTICHEDPDNAKVYPRITEYIAKFPHEAHLEQDVECLACHVGVDESDNIYDKHLPGMSSCVDCHNDMQQVDYCYQCHAQQEDLKPTDHQLTWTHAHGIASQTQEAACQMCHHENQCLDCHEGDNLDRQVHPLNYKFNHALSAKGNKDNCYTCHENYSFCIDCHRQELVMPRTHASAGWSNLNTGGRHARAAKLDLDSCLSCHSGTGDEPICAQCHAAQ